MALGTMRWGMFVVLALLVAAEPGAWAQTRTAPALNPALLRLPPAGTSRVQWRPGIGAAELRAAPIVHIAPGFRGQDLAVLRDDQTIETPSGRRVAVARIRLIMNVIATARTRPTRPALFAILPPTFAPCTPPRQGETQVQLLARPDSDSICTPNGHSVSVGQLRAMALFARQHPEFAGRRSRILGSPNGRAIAITNVADLENKARTSLKHAPDSTVLVGPKGTRVTLGALKAFLRPKMPPGAHPLTGNAQ